MITEAASGVTDTAATLNGSVNPDTATISACVFEWGPEKAFDEVVQTYPNTAPCVPGPGSIAGESPVAVEADLSGLHTGSQYAYRLKATYPSGGVTGATLIAQTTGPRIAATWAEDVIRTEATLKAEIDPEGQATTYHFEYGTSEAYGSETPEIAVGSDSSTHEVTRFLEGLTPGTTYHYRAIATSAGGENVGPDRSFTTYRNPAPNTDCPNQIFRSGPAANLPDCRGYEMVSPIEKGGGDITTINPAGEVGVRGSMNQASLDGNKITYSAPTAFAGSVSSRNINQYIASRGGDGWSTEPINAPLGATVYHGQEFNSVLSFENMFKLFTPDLSTAWMTDQNATPLTPGGDGERASIYRRDNLGGLSAVTPPVAENALSVFSYLPTIDGHSADFSHVVFRRRQS